MHFQRERFYLFLAAGLVVAALMGCQPTPAQPTLMPTLTINQPEAQPTQAPPGGAATAAQPQAEPNAYPAPGESAAGATAEAPGYPVDSGADALPTEDPGAYPGPEGAPVVANRAKVTVTLLEKAPDANNADITRLHVSVQAVEDVESMPNQAKDLVNKETDLYFATALLPELNPNDRFEAVVAYEGDENGGRFSVLEIKKLE